MERGHSSHQSVTTLSSGFDFNPVPTEWVLAVYKHKVRAIGRCEAWSGLRKLTVV